MEHESGGCVFAITEAIAERENSEATDLPPLHDSVDPEALSDLVGSGSDGSGALRIEFPYCGYDVRVAGNGRIDISAAD